MINEEYRQKVNKIIEERARIYIKMMMNEKKTNDASRFALPAKLRGMQSPNSLLEMLGEAINLHCTIEETYAYKGYIKLKEITPQYVKILEDKLGREIGKNEVLFSEEWSKIYRLDDKADCLRQAVIKKCEVTELELYKKMIYESRLNSQFMNLVRKQIENGSYRVSGTWLEIKDCDYRINILKEALQKRCHLEQTELFKEYEKNKKIYREHSDVNNDKIKNDDEGER